MENKGNLLASFSQNNQKNNSNSEQSSENINIDHSVVYNKHNNYDFINNKEIAQNTKESINPDKTTNKLKLPAKNGLMNTEAKNTNPTSAEISESLEIRESDKNNVNLMQDNDTPNENNLSTEPIRNSRGADLCPYCLMKHRQRFKI